MKATTFDPKCARCERLARFLKDVRAEHPDYHCAPVAPFGAKNPGLLIVGLAPGMHGANATGRPFTGDYAGILLYETLHEFGFANRPTSESANDGLKLKDCRITNAVKCLPPQNKPVGAEVRECNEFLAAELESLRPGAVVMALGSLAHSAIIKAFGLKAKDYPFGHGVEHELPKGRILIDSYHCSRYNTQTKRLTPEMFKAVFSRVKELQPN